MAFKVDMKSEIENMKSKSGFSKDHNSPISVEENEKCANYSQ